MNHKRRRPKSRRAGCLLCKPHKANGCEEHRPSVKRRLQDKPMDLWFDDDFAQIRGELSAP